MAVTDATTLMLLLRPDVGIPTGPGNVKIDHPIERLKHLVDTLEKRREKIIIPAPALSEVLVRVTAKEAEKIVDYISTQSIFRVEPFGQRAAIEVAIMTRNSADGGKKPAKRDPQATWAKLKYDRQIVATALVVGATTIYSDDRDIRAIAKRAGIQVIGLADLELPPEDAQLKIPFEQAHEQPSETAIPEPANDADPVPVRSVSGDGSAA